MKKITFFTSVTSKISLNGDLQYSLWVDKNGSLYIQLEKNEDSGTFSNLLFSVSEYGSKRKIQHALGDLRGYDIESQSFVVRKDNNNSAFLKAALRDLLPVD